MRKHLPILGQYIHGRSKSSHPWKYQSICVQYVFWSLHLHLNIKIKPKKPSRNNEPSLPVLLIYSVNWSYGPITNFKTQHWRTNILKTFECTHFTNFKSQKNQKSTIFQTRFEMWVKNIVTLSMKFKILV